MKSTTAGHKAAPSGVVTFEINGLNYSRTNNIALKADGTKATASLTTEMTSVLPKGAYTLDVYYQGSRVFAPQDLGQATLVSGEEGYRLIICDKAGNEIDTMTYGEGWSAKLIQYTQAYGTVTATELTDWEIGSEPYRREDDGTWSNPKEVTEESGTWDEFGTESEN